MTDETRVFIRHCREASMCITGVKYYCKRHDLDYKELMRNGLLVSDLEQINDPLMDQVIKLAKNERRS